MCMFALFFLIIFHMFAKIVQAKVSKQRRSTEPRPQSTFGTAMELPTD